MICPQSSEDGSLPPTSLCPPAKRVFSFAWMPDLPAPFLHFPTLYPVRSCGAVRSATSLPKFSRMVAAMFLRDTGNYLPDCKASRPCSCLCIVLPVST